MPAAKADAVRKQIARGTPDAVYLILGDDEFEMSQLAGEFTGLVDEGLRPFNTERFHAGEKGVDPATVVAAARTLPMMADRRVVVVLRAERMLKPKRRGRPASPEAGGEGDDGEAPTDLDALEQYVKDPVPQTTLVLVASEVDRTRKVYKAIQKHATIVECCGLKEAGRSAVEEIRRRVAGAGQEIAPGAVKLLAERAGTDIGRLRGDMDRLLLYTAGSRSITLDDARQVVSAEAAQDDWAVTNAIQRGDAAEALRQLALTLEAGGVPFKILGQLAWFVREKMPLSHAKRVPAAIDALFRTDLELKSSAGDPRVLLERLVATLCRG